MRRAVWALTLLGAAACGANGPTHPITGVPIAADLVILGGNQQTDTVAHTLADAVRVRAEDSSGTPIAGQLVNFVVTGGGGAVYAAASLTDSLGIAANRWTLGDTAGTQTLELRAVTADGTPVAYARVQATALPGIVATLALTTTDTTVGLGQSLDLPRLVAGASDRYGNVVADPTLRVSAAAPWALAGMAIASDRETADTITVAAGVAAATFVARALVDVRTLTWGLVDSCYGASTATRGTENPPAGLDSLLVTLASDSIVADSARYGGKPVVYLRGPAARFWGDGVADTVTLERELPIFAQAPDSLETNVGWFVGSAASGIYAAPGLPVCGSTNFATARPAHLTGS